MNICVTGIAGFIGSNLALRLSSLGHRVYGIDNFSDYYDPSLKEDNARAVEDAGGIIIRADLAEDDLEKTLDRDTDAIFHLAAQPGISSSVSFEAYLKNNVVATHKLYEAARALPRLKLFVHVSTSSVYGAHAVVDEEAPPRPTSYYGVTKLAAEQLILAHAREDGFPACVFRPFSIYGERERPEKMCSKLIESILSGSEFPLHQGSELHKRSFTYVGDLIDAMAAALGKPEAVNGQIFNIGNPDSVTVGSVIGTIESIMGKRAKLKSTPKRAGDQDETKAVIDKAGRLLRFSPKTSIEQGLRKQIAWQTARAARDAV